MTELIRGLSVLLIFVPVLSFVCSQWSRGENNYSKMQNTQVYHWSHLRREKFDEFIGFQQLSSRCHAKCESSATHLVTLVMLLCCGHALNTYLCRFEGQCWMTPAVSPTLYSRYIFNLCSRATYLLRITKMLSVSLCFVLFWKYWSTF